MTWIRNNKFLAGFLAFVAIVAGVLIYLLVVGLGRYDQVSDEYQSQVAELKRLQGLEPYPDPANLTKLDDLKKRYDASVADLQNRLAKFEPAPESPPPTPIQFQDKLRRVVDEVSHSAQQSGVMLPENFYLGFEQYRGTPPDAAAAPPLSRELDEIQDLVNVLLSNKRIEKLNFVKRAPLPQEAGGSPASNNPTGGRPAAGKSTAAPDDLVIKRTVEIGFSSQPSSFREILNQVTSANRLYVVRALQVKNQVDKGPARDDGSAPGGPGPGPGGPGGPGGPPPGGSLDPNGVPVPPLPEKAPLRYVVGLERLDVDLRIELVRVMPR